ETTIAHQELHHLGRKDTIGAPHSSVTNHAQISEEISGGGVHPAVGIDIAPPSSNPVPAAIRTRRKLRGPVAVAGDQRNVGNARTLLFRHAFIDAAVKLRIAARL